MSIFDLFKAKPEPTAAEKTAQLKADLIKLFTNYYSSRTGIITDHFRNKALSEAKKVIAGKAIQLVNTFSGNTASLIDQLKQLRTENAGLSRTHNKPHYNLDDWNTKKEWQFLANGYAAEQTIKNIRPGEISNDSGLASRFHSAIDYVTRSGLTTVNFKANDLVAEEPRPT